MKHLVSVNITIGAKEKTIKHLHGCLQDALKY